MGGVSEIEGNAPPGDGFAVAAARLLAGGGSDLCAPVRASVSMPGAVVSTLGPPLGSQTVCASTALGERIDEIQIDLGEGPSWQAMRTRRHVAADLRSVGGGLWPGASAALRELELGALYAFPLFVGTVDVGALALYSPVARHLSPQEIDGVSGLATIIATTLLRRELDRLDGPDDASADGQYSRRQVHQATGMIAARTGAGVDDALMLLRGHAYADGRPVREVAADIVARRLDLSAWTFTGLG